MGPGVLLKAVFHGTFSLLVFGWAQIVMDLQPLFALLSGAGRLHGFSHTYLGATLLAALAALTGKYLAEFALRMRDIPRCRRIVIAWRVTLLSAFIGTYSHVALDSIMHADMTPYFPFSDRNHLLRTLSVDTLQRVCIYTGIVGAGAYLLIDHLLVKRRTRLRDSSASDDPW